MSKSNNEINMGLPAILFVVFLTLKLVGGNPVSQWSWWWVTSPLWIPFLLLFVIIVVFFILGVIFALFKK